MGDRLSCASCRWSMHCMSLTLGCSTFLDLSETYPQFTTRDTHSDEILLPLILEILKP